MSIIRTLTLTLALITLGACGGGSAGLAPPVGPGGSPADVINTDLIGFIEDETFNLGLAVIGNGTVSQEALADPSLIAVSDGGSTLSVSVATTAVSATDTVNVGTGFDILIEDGFFFFDNLTFFANEEETLGLFLIDSFIASSAPGETDTLDFQKFGFWASADDEDLDSFGVFHFGVQTLASDLPITGIASYNGVMVGIASEAGSPQISTDTSVAGLFAATADFTAATVTTDFEFAITGPFVDTFVDLSGTVPITAAASSFGGTVPGISTNFITGLQASSPATVEGGFFGPGAAEIGGTVAGTASGFDYVAIFGGAQN